MAGDAPSATGRASGRHTRRDHQQALAPGDRVPDRDVRDVPPDDAPADRPLAADTRRRRGGRGDARADAAARQMDHALAGRLRDRVPRDVGLRRRHPDVLSGADRERGVPPHGGSATASTTLARLAHRLPAGPRRAPAVAHLAFQTERDAIRRAPRRTPRPERPGPRREAPEVRGAQRRERVRVAQRAPAADARPAGAAAGREAGRAGRHRPQHLAGRLGGDRGRRAPRRLRQRALGRPPGGGGRGGRRRRTTTVSWLEGLGAPRRPGREPVDPDEHPEFWVFRGQAWPFGYNAPSLALFRSRPKNVPDAGETYLPEDTAHPTHLYLDTAYPGIVEGGWVALLTSRIDTTDNPELTGYEEYVELYPVVAAMDTAHANYLLAGKSTRVTLDAMQPEQWAARLESAPGAVRQRLGGSSEPAPEHIEYFPVRGTIALIQSERIPLADVPLGHSPLSAAASQARPVEGTMIELDRSYPDLRRGRTLLVTGMLVDAAGARIGAGSEAVVVATLETAAGRTAIRFASAMKGRYERSSIVIYGNVVRASHGESVATESLGDGDASREFQGSRSAEAPVTYVPDRGVRRRGRRHPAAPHRRHAAGPRGRSSTVSRSRRARLRHAQAGRPDHARPLRADGRSHGARAPSGRNNVTADYRVGLGPDGNVRAGHARTLLKKPLGLKRVTNPGAAAEALARRIRPRSRRARRAPCGRSAASSRYGTSRMRQASTSASPRLVPASSGTERRASSTWSWPATTARWWTWRPPACSATWTRVVTRISR